MEAKWSSTSLTVLVTVAFRLMKCALVIFLGVTLMVLRMSAAEPAAPAVIPVIEMDKVPLSDAIRQLARQAQLNILLDPRLSEAPFAGMTVSVHWEGVSAKEGLVALLDNYGLVLVEAARPSPAH